MLYGIPAVALVVKEYHTSSSGLPAVVAVHVSIPADGVADRVPGSKVLVGLHVAPNVKLIAPATSSFTGGGATSLMQTANSPDPMEPVPAW